jgi:NAD(P)-dependent dehydrogenase (short-subunit alcohol dehydrogenase family)
MPTMSIVSSVRSREPARVKVNAICPAAIKTPMLAAGCEGAARGLRCAASGSPRWTYLPAEEVAHLARYQIAEAHDFLDWS